jgi:hypothetical protein
MLFVELDQGLCGKQLAQRVRARLHPPPLDKGDASQLGGRGAPVIVVGLTALIEPTVAAIPTPHGCSHSPRRYVVKSRLECLTARFCARLILLRGWPA